MSLVMHEAFVPLAFGMFLILFHEIAGSSAYHQQRPFRGNVRERTYQLAFLLCGAFFIVVGLIWLVSSPGKA